MIWFVAVCMALTVYRATRLITRDTFPPVLWMRDHLAGGWRPLTEQEWRWVKNPEIDSSWMRTTSEMGDREHRWVERQAWSPYWLAELITCPWCASGWIAGALTATVDLTYGLPVPWLVGPAVWGAGALLASKEWA